MYAPVITMVLEALGLTGSSCFPPPLPKEFPVELRTAVGESMRQNAGRCSPNILTTFHLSGMLTGTFFG